MPSPLSLAEFFQTHHKPLLAPTTAADYQIQLRHFSRAIQAGDNGATLDDLSIAHLSLAINARLASGVAHGTADKLRRSVMAVWRRAALLKLVAPPADAIKALKTLKREPVAWSVAEFGLLLDAVEKLDGAIGPHAAGDWMQALLWVVYNSGLRITAAMSIEWSWIDLASRRLVVPPEVQKDDEGLNVILLAETAAAISRIRAGGSGQVFGDWPSDRRCVQWPALTQRLRACIVAAGLARSVQDVSRRDLWHKLRRTFATAIYAESNDIELVRDMLGHSTAEVTWRYIDKSLIDRKSQADLLPIPARPALTIHRVSDAG